MPGTGQGMLPGSGGHTSNGGDVTGLRLGASELHSFVCVCVCWHVGRGVGVFIHTDDSGGGSRGTPVIVRLAEDLGRVLGTGAQGVLWQCGPTRTRTLLKESGVETCRAKEAPTTRDVPEHRMVSGSLRRRASPATRGASPSSALW